MIKMNHGLMTNTLDANGELSDEAARHIMDVIKTKAAILEYIEPIAQVLAEAGRASAKAMGDDPHYALDQWLGVIRRRAKEIMREPPSTLRHGTMGHDGRNPLRELIEGEEPPQTEAEKST